MSLMVYRPPHQSARARAVALWDAGDTRSDAELAAELGVTTQTLRAYHQKWNREHGRRNGRKLPNEIVVAILEMRNHGRMTFPAISEVVGEDYDYEVSAEHVRMCYYRGAATGGQTVDVVEADLPLMTFSGIVWTVPEMMRGSCGRCRYRERCPSANTTVMLPCERPLDWEVMSGKLVGTEGILV